MTASYRGPMDLIDAAGGVVWRQGESGLEVLLIHRPLRDDWTLPVGRVEPGETIPECALREVAEETGYTCALGNFIDTLEFVGADDGMVHRFHIFAMTVVSGEFVANPETDRTEWLSLDEACRRATYPNVRNLLATVAEGLARN